VKISPVDVLIGVLCSVIVFQYYMTKHWLLNNIIGICFSYQGVALLGLQIKSYSVGCILLIGLFFYDIFWVFGTDVMVTVAKSFDAPIKVLFPRDMFAAEWKFAMLGLGDIVLPGAFIAFLLRYDHFKASQRKTHTDDRPYFNINFVSYTVGLCTTFGVMHVFQAAQPALLYLVPACVGASLGTAFLLGDFAHLSTWEEKDDKEEKKPEKTEKKKKVVS